MVVSPDSRTSARSPPASRQVCQDSPATSTGFPFTAGFVSKDAVIESAYAAHTVIGNYGFVLTLLAAALTSFYSWRLMFLVFEGKPREKPEVLAHAHEPP